MKQTQVSWRVAVVVLAAAVVGAIVMFSTAPQGSGPPSTPAAAAHQACMEASHAARVTGDEQRRFVQECTLRLNAETQRQKDAIMGRTR